MDDVIYSANGKPLGDKAWLVMADAITESETREANGKLVLGVRRGPDNIDVELTLEVMGNYSPTAPYDCPKTEKIIAGVERWIVERGGAQGRNKDFLGSDSIFLLATGNPDNLGHVRRAVYQILETKIQPGPIPRPLDPADIANGTVGSYNGAVSAAGILMGFVNDHRSAHLCSIISTYSFNHIHDGHGGNFWNNFWTPLGAHQHGKEAYIHFWKNHRWYRELSRMHDGTLIGGGRPTGGYGVALVAPRKRIQIVGAPPSPFAVDAPAVLKPALDAYWNRDYAACGKIIEDLMAELIAKGKKAKDIEGKTGNLDIDLALVRKMIQAGERDAAIAYIEDLQSGMAEDDKRLRALQDMAKGKGTVEPAKKQEEEPRQWACLVMQDDTGDNRRGARRGPVIKTPEQQPNLWKIKVVENMNQAPDGWSAPSFDDASWPETTLPKSWRMYHTALLRTRFTVDDKERFDALRLHSWVLMWHHIHIRLEVPPMPKGWEFGCGFAGTAFRAAC